MIGYHFGMHETGVLLDGLMLVLMLVIVTRAIEVARPYLSGRCQRQCANQA